MPISDYNYKPCLSKFAMARRLYLLNLIECTQSGLDRAKREGKTNQKNCQ